jgi:hypothetical protein
LKTATQQKHQQQQQWRQQWQQHCRQPHRHQQHGRQQAHIGTSRGSMGLLAWQKWVSMAAAVTAVVER